jgi:phosphopantetheinyl transferase
LLSASPSPVVNLPLRLVIVASEMPDASFRRRSANQRRVQSAIGRNLAREAAARLHHCRVVEFHVEGGGSSPPLLTHYSTHAQETAISISHSGKWVCAVAGRRQRGLGIDVQAIEPRNIAGLTRFMDWTSQLPAPTGNSASDMAMELDKFTHLWTVWEAAVKCDGVAVLTRSTPAFEALAPHCCPGTPQSWSALEYWAHSQCLDDGHWLTVVCTGPTPPALEVHFVETGAAMARRA